MTKFAINEEMLSGLLKRSKTKQVFAFEEIQLENPIEYVEWAVSCLGIGFDDFLLPLVSHFGKPSVNYYEILCDLRTFFSRSNILPIHGTVAVDLYFIGCLEDLINGHASEWSTLQHLADLLRSNQGSMEYCIISKLYYQYWHPYDSESCDLVLKRFHDEACRFVGKFRLSLTLKGGSWYVTVA